MFCYNCGEKTKFLFDNSHGIPIRRKEMQMNMHPSIRQMKWEHCLTKFRLDIISAAELRHLPYYHVQTIS